MRMRALVIPVSAPIMRYAIVVTTDRNPLWNLPLYEATAVGLPVFGTDRGKTMIRLVFTIACLCAFVGYGHAGDKGQAPQQPAKKQSDTKGDLPKKVQSASFVEVVREGKIKWRRPKLRAANCPCPE